MDQLRKAFGNLTQAIAIMEDVETNLYKHAKDSGLGVMCTTAQDRLADLLTEVKNTAALEGVDLTEDN